MQKKLYKGLIAAAAAGAAVLANGFGTANAQVQENHMAPVPQEAPVIAETPQEPGATMTGTPEDDVVTTSSTPDDDTRRATTRS